ncbi:hypothetical protein B296_00058757, partial [Ensete ventricosum]
EPLARRNSAPPGWKTDCSVEEDNDSLTAATSCSSCTHSTDSNLQFEETRVATIGSHCIFYSHIMRVTLAVTQTILRWWSDLGVGGLELQCAALMATLKLEVKIWMFCPLIP